MAEQSLFGATPEALQASRANALQAQALQYAKLDPFQRANMSIYQGAGQLGGAIGGMLGGQDPEMMRIKQRQQLLQGIDLNSPEALIRAAQQASQIGDYGAAQELSTKARALQLQGATLAKTEAEALKAGRERAGADPLQQLIRSGKYTPASVAAYEKTGKIEDLDLIEKLSQPEIQRLQTYRDTLPVGSAARAEVDKVIQAEGRGKGTTITNLLPGVKGAGDLVGLRSEINKTAKPFRDAVNSADEAITLADDVLKTGNFASFASLTRSLAKAAGETQLSKADVAAFGGDPSLVGRVSDLVSNLATGTPTPDTTKKLKSLAVILKKKNKALEDAETEQLQKTAQLSGLYTDEQIKNVFTLRGAPKGTPTTFDQDKEARYQAWKKAQSTPKGF